MTSTDADEEPNTSNPESGVKTVSDILKSSAKDDSKFGLLTVLIEQNKVSNKDVVDTVLHLVSLYLYLYNNVYNGVELGTFFLKSNVT